MQIYHEMWPVDEEAGSIVIVHGPASISSATTG